LPIAGKHLDLKEYRLFIFGSRALGTASPTSDIDIGIQGSRVVPRHLLAALREDIKETPLLNKVDVVDFLTVSDDFRDLAMKNSIMITT
jgi:predicted nucleotidyltransferase